MGGHGHASTRGWRGGTGAAAPAAHVSATQAVLRRRRQAAVGRKYLLFTRLAATAVAALDEWIKDSRSCDHLHESPKSKHHRFLSLLLLLMKSRTAMLAEA